MAELPTTPTRTRNYYSSIPSPKAGSYSPVQYKRRDANAKSSSSSGAIPYDRDEENLGSNDCTAAKSFGSSCSTHLTSFYKENIRELNQLQDILFQKKAMLDSLNDELSECRLKYNNAESKWETLREEKASKIRQLQLKSNELIKLKQEQSIQRAFVTQGHELNLQQLRAKNEAEVNKRANEYRETVERLRYSKIRKFQQDRDALLDRVEGIRNAILTNNNTLQDMLKQKDMKHCISKEKWLEQYQEKWKENVKINEAYSSKNDTLNVEIIESLKPEVGKKRRKLEELTIEQDNLSKSLEINKMANVRLKDEVASKIDDIDKLQQEKEQLQAYIKNTEVELQQIHEILMKEESMRRSLHNELQELRGNIRVFCRVRPALSHENSRSENICVRRFDDSAGTQTIDIQKEKRGSAPYTFKFDRIFDQSETNNDVFEEICQLIQSSLDGYNVCIFAYGQTGSGKTYTMLNPRDGIIPSTIAHIFNWIDTLKERGWQYEISCQFVEIYNEVIADLLRNENSVENGQEDGHRNVRHEIRHDQENKTTIITNVTSCQLQKPESVEGLLRKANKLRSTASTAANDRSSRSHSIFIIHLNGVNKISGEESSGVLNLVDLAGSERINTSQVVGERLRETQNINKSLSCLGDVIHALGSPDASKRHIPFRNSKLTYLLKFSLMGNSKTLMFVNISACSENINENINSLRFASKVNSTRLVTRKNDDQ